MALFQAMSRKGFGIYTQQAFGRLKEDISREAGIAFKWKDCRPTGGQLALDAGVPIDQVSQSMRHASTKTTERYYCRARAVPAFARVNEAYNTLFRPEPAIRTEKD
jgi:integrase